MAHIHEKIDFVVTIWIVFENRVLMIFHKKAQLWLPVGGHVELDEDPEETLYREVKEECGLEIELIGDKRMEGYPTDSRRKLLPTPAYMDIHHFNDTHRHISLAYFARAKSDKMVLAEEEHDQIRWFTEEELEDPQYALIPEMKFLAREALKRAS
ncbi:NUDIX domain-containing protein [Candidatus Parcubacteria bacterium]|nr:NUDIX domain-containing protein [Candidatus Parcubacteria bacterium]